MAVQWDSKTMQRTGDLWGEYPENIVVIPELNGRHENTDIDTLVADIEANGQHTPCGFRKGEDNETILVYGHRRYRAVLEVNKRRKARGESPIKLMGTYFRGNDEQAFRRAISENRERRDVSPVDDAYNIGVLKTRFNYSLEEIAQIYFPHYTKKEQIAEALRFVKQREALLELAPEAAQAVRDGRIKITAAVHLAKLSRDNQRQVIKSQPTGKIKTTAVSKTKAVAVAKVSEAKSLLKLVKKVLKDVTLERLEDTDYPEIEVNREALLAVWQFVNPK